MRLLGFGPPRASEQFARTDSASSRNLTIEGVDPGPNGSGILVSKLMRIGSQGELGWPFHPGSGDDAHDILIRREGAAALHLESRRQRRCARRLGSHAFARKRSHGIYDVVVADGLGRAAGVANRLKRDG